MMENKMNNTKGAFAVKATLIAVQGVLLALTMTPNVYADDSATVDSAVTELTKPVSKIELGVGSVSDRSFKAGEYTGLEDKGAYGIANIDLRGGDAYDSDGTLQYRLKGNNLGLENRDISAEIGEQGKFKFSFGYDELLRNRSDSYKTPFLGAGTNTLTLPSTWKSPYVEQASATKMNYRSLDPALGDASYIYSTGAVRPASTATGLGGSYPGTGTYSGDNAVARVVDLPLFHNVDLYTKREKYSGGFSYNIDSQWEFKTSMVHEDKNGFKPMGALNMATKVGSSTAGTTSTSSVIPDLIDQTTDQYNASLNYTEDGRFLQVAYYGSVFRNHVGSMNWENPSQNLYNTAGQGTTLTTMSSAPSNEFHQLNLTGGYNFTPTTKLVMNGSYGRNTQNDAFINGAEMLAALPTNSLHGLVVTEAFNMKLTAKPIKDLNFSGAYKFENRDNRTPVNTYVFGDAGEAPSSAASPFAGLNNLPSALRDNANIYANRAYSKKSNQINLDADYKLTQNQWIKGGYDFQKIDRQCDGTWYNCADATATKENTVRAQWRMNATDNLNGKVGYSYSQRTVNYDPNAWLAFVPMANVIPTYTATGTHISAYSIIQQLGLGGFGPLASYVSPQGGSLGIYYPSNSAMPQALYGSRNDIHELPGMRRFNMADRDRNKITASVNWQANDKLSLQGGVNFNKDDYNKSVYGLTSGQNWALNLDGNYALSDESSFGVFYNHEDQQSKSAGDSYSAGAITNASTVNLAGNTVVSGGCYATVTLKNQNAKVDPCLNWGNTMKDKVDTLGFSLNRKNLMAGKFDLGGDLIFSWARTNVDVSGGTYVNSPYALAGAPIVSPAILFIPAGNLPTVRTDTVELRLNGKYTITKKASVRLLYSFLHMKAVDYAYDGMQYGTMATVMPTSEIAPSYNVHAIAASYIYTF